MFTVNYSMYHIRSKLPTCMYGYLRLCMVMYAYSMYVWLHMYLCMYVTDNCTEFEELFYVLIEMLSLNHC